MSWKDLKVISDATPEHIKKLTIKHVNQRRLRDTLCISVRREDPRQTTLRTGEKCPIHVETM